MIRLLLLLLLEETPPSNEETSFDFVKVLEFLRKLWDFDDGEVFPDSNSFFTSAMRLSKGALEEADGILGCDDGEEGLTFLGDDWG